MKTVKRYINQNDIERRERFINNNIPYDAIDPEMLELIDILNFNLGYKTDQCCYGHFKYNNKITSTLNGIDSIENREYIDGFSIKFDKSVNDEMIHILIKDLPYLYSQYFLKWDRMLDYKILSNWNYDSIEFDNLEEKNNFLDELCNLLNNVIMNKLLK